MSAQSFIPTTTRRFWVTVFVFILINAIAWVVYDRTFAAWHRGVLRVEAFEPGDNAVLDSRATVRWHFSDDVLPTSTYGKDPGKVTPAVAGRWAWENPRTLSFIPAVDFPRATPVTFTLANDLLRTGTGAAMKTPYVSCIHSSPLEIEEIHQSAAIDNDEFVLELKFNDRVAPGDVLVHAKANLVNGKNVGLRLYGQSAGDIVRLATDPVSTDGPESDTQLVMKLSPGLTGLSGPLGLADAFTDNVSLGRKLMATQMTATSPTRERPSLSISFNKEVEISALKKVLTIEPAVPFTMESNGSDQITLHGDFESGTRYTAHIAAVPAGASSSEKAKSPKPTQLAVFVPDMGSEVWFDNDEGYLSTAGNRTLLAHAVNVANMRVSITRMYDNNLVAWRNSNYNNTDDFSKPVASKTISCAAAKNTRRDVRVSLDDLLPANADRAGVWKVVISPVKSGSDDDEEDRYSHGNEAVVTMSDIGLTAKQTHDGLVAWATSLHTAQPMDHVRVRAFSNKNQLLGEAVTGDDGLARLADIHPAKDEVISVLLADVIPLTVLGPTTQPMPAAQLTWLDLRRTGWELGDSDISGAAYLRSGSAAYVYTDRGVYRPGETVHLRAIVRAAGDVAPKNSFPVKWQLRRPDLRDWKNETVMLDNDGAASLDIALPSDLPSGQWSATLGLPGDAKNASFGSINFLVEDFVPNRLKTSLDFKVGEEKDPKRYSISDTPLDVEVAGDYLFGRPGAGLSVDLSNHAVPIAFHPTGWEGWSFGDTARIANIANTAIPVEAKSTRSHRGHRKPATPAMAAGDEQTPEELVLDGNGRYRGSLNVADIVHLPDDASKADSYMGPWMLSTQAGVREAGGRAVTTGKTIAIDALPAYIAMRMGDGHTTAKPGETAEFQVKMAKPNGTPATEIEKNLQGSLLRETWNSVFVFRDGRYHYDCTRVLNPVSSATISLADGMATWSVKVPDSGEYVAKISDAETGAITTTEFYCTDGSGWDENVDRENPERLQLRILGNGEDEDSKSSGKSAPTAWHVGDVARVVVASPFKGKLLLSVETDDVVQSTVVDMTSTHMVVPVTVTDACWPNAFVSATVIRGIDPNAKWQTHRAFGVTRLNVDSSARQLQMTLDAPAVIRPEQSMDVGVKVTDNEGNAVSNAAVTLAAVDEGICSLTDFKTPDPLKFFSSKRALGVQSADVFGLLMPEVAKPDGTREVGGDKPDIGGSRYHSPVGARRVKPVALAWAEVHTDADGYGRTSFSLPQFQGKLRVIAVGYNAKLLGSADRGVIVRSPILAQSSWPRFAAPGDQFTVPVVLFNNSNIGGDAVVTAELLNDEKTPAGLLSLGSDGKAMVELPPVAITAGGQQQVNFNVTVAQAVGVAKVRLTVAMGEERYQEEMELPVRPASPMKQFGGIQSVSTTQPVALTAATNLMPGTDSLRVSVTPFPTLNLPQGMDYLDRYPYGCVEQTTSTCFPLIALGPIGKQIDPVTFSEDHIREKVDSGITRLIGLQTADGGLGFWHGGEERAYPWGSVYAAHFLTEAKAAGYQVPADFYDHLLGYVRHLMDTGSDDPSQLEVQAYAAYVMALAGKPERAIMDHLTELSSASARQDEGYDEVCMRGDARLMLSCAWLLSGRRDLAEGLMPDAVPEPRTDRQQEGNLGSPIRDRALLILAMEQVQPNRAELPELVQQLADQGFKKQWGSTQDVAFSVLAIGRYLRDQGSKTPYESAKLFFGETKVAEVGKGGSLTWLAEAAQLRSPQPIRLELTGANDAIGHMTWLQTGIPLSPPKDAEHGLKIHRKYLALDGKDLVGAIRSGDLVRVELTIEAPPDQPNIVIEDLLPAGLEVENARLATAAKDDSETGKDDSIFGNGNIDVQDDRVVIVGRMPSEWKAHCTYLARAITAGTFTVPPVRAEAMYDLNTNAISGAGKITVLPVERNVAAAD